MHFLYINIYRFEEKKYPYFVQVVYFLNQCTHSKVIPNMAEFIINLNRPESPRNPIFEITQTEIVLNRTSTCWY